MKTKTDDKANLLTLTIDMSTVQTAESDKYPGHLFLNPIGNPYGKVKATGSDGRTYNLKVSVPPLREDKARAAASADVKAAEGNAIADALKATNAKVDRLADMFGKLLSGEVALPKAAKAR